MRLDLRTIIHRPGAELPFEHTLDLSQVDLFGACPFAHPVHIHGLVRNRAGALELKAAVDTTLELVCDRCLKPFRQEMELPVEHLLAETLEEEEDDDILLLEDGQLDLDEVFTTDVILAMEPKHVCSEDCKGLCPKCGADLNEGPCRCKADVDPRLAVLAQLLDKESDD